ncbi:molybdopterin molybdotransferase MoeA [Sphingomonas oligophenolica]|uniref:Molybdopterin molybdenumtransferase n=1 Tax=Sphingomonas oligophenolica TaxID=301154 RepID=A0A502CJ78_9SPHN|nr:molybdopterin molybdotransferase MoeA [Sphingomonas oligophenolica]TPG12694.1 molybdopterin molybdenumtransferase MoeA [Sphingomonas oligophenolica]
MTLIPIDEAQRRLFALAKALGTETVAITAAAGRYAAEPIVARRTQPAADLSAMDGYAIRFDDLPGPWWQIGESAAGRPFAGEVGAGETVRIFTGAAMPAGADTVMIQEEVAADGAAIALVGAGPATRGRNTRRKGLDFATGVTLVEPGQRITPARLAVAITGGAIEAVVRRKVRVAIVSTGDELVAPGMVTDGLSLPESNSPMLGAMLADLPVEIVQLGILPDDLATLTDAFRRVDADLLVTTGGASVGDHDLVRPALEAAGGSIDFWRIALRPGKPMMAGRLGDAMMLGLPGNPVSAFVTALLFVRPLVAHLGGARDPFPTTTHAILGEDLPANNARTDYLRAELRPGPAGIRAYASTIQDSSMLRTLARSNCLVIRPANAPAARAGDAADILVIA